MSLPGVRLSKEELAEIERKRLNRAAEADAYDNFTAAGQPYFFKGIELIENLIADNIMAGNLDIDTRILARIKDQESALNNDNLLLMNKHMLMRVIMDSINSEDYTIKYLDEDYEEKGKTLDDVFGITIVVASDEERNIMDKLLTENFHVRNRKKMNKN